MRTLVMILMIAISFSGYSAAAHAFDMESCISMSITQDIGIDMSDCPGHQDDVSSAPTSDNDSHAKTVCLDCHHCCASHAISISNYEVTHPPQAKLHTMPSANGYFDYFAFSLLRPPRTLV